MTPNPKWCPLLRAVEPFSFGSHHWMRGHNFDCRQFWIWFGCADWWDPAGLPLPQSECPHKIILFSVSYTVSVDHGSASRISAKLWAFFPPFFCLFSANVTPYKQYKLLIALRVCFGTRTRNNWHSCGIFAVILRQSCVLKWICFRTIKDQEICARWWKQSSCVVCPVVVGFSWSLSLPPTFSALKPDQSHKVSCKTKFLKLIYLFSKKNVKSLQ